MKITRHIAPGHFVKKVCVILAFFSLAQYVFAVDGTLDGGKKSSKVFSTIKSDLSLSLKSGYRYQGNKNFGTRRTPNLVMSNSVVTYQRGNVTWVLPYRSKTAILQKFRTPTPPIR